MVNLDKGMHKTRIDYFNNQNNNPLYRPQSLWRFSAFTVLQIEGARNIWAFHIQLIYLNYQLIYVNCQLINLNYQLMYLTPLGAGW